MTGKFDLTNINNMAFYISGPKLLFDSTGVKLYIFIHNEVLDFDKNSTQPEIRDNESTVVTLLTISAIMSKSYMY